MSPNNWLHRTIRHRIAAALAAAILLACAVLAMLFWAKGNLLPHNYAYLAYHSKETGITLHALTVQPEQIELRSADRPLRDYRIYGMNGGFFYQDSVLSIAVNGDVPVKGQPGGYGTGWFNAKYARGTLVWDTAAEQFSVQVVSSADELEVADRNRYFAQGGISMNLGDEDGWEAAMELEHLPYPDEKRLRSGLVYDDSGLLWLIVTPDRCTAKEFRAAITGGVAPDRAKEGIFLDGDGSSQLNSAEISLYGDARELRQIIAIH